MGRKKKQIEDKNETKKPKKEKEHYVDNKLFYKEMVDWKKKYKEAQEMDEPVPPVSEYIATCFFHIAENLAKKPNFVNYPFKEDMIGDGIENCLMYCGNFNPRKSKNPFSYFTQIIYYAFLRKIQKEKKQNFIKYKFLESQDVTGEFSEFLKLLGINEEEGEMYKKMSDEKLKEKEEKKKKKKKKKNVLEEFE
jgi:hypothetical protein